MNALRQFRHIAFAEGISFVLLLFIAMPLKYFAGLPLAVRIVGSVHGVLFVLFMLALARVIKARGWPAERALLAFGSSLVPFGTFVFDRSLHRELLTESISAGKS